MRKVGGEHSCRCGTTTERIDQFEVRNDAKAVRRGAARRVTYDDRPVSRIHVHSRVGQKRKRRWDDCPILVGDPHMRWSKKQVIQALSQLSVETHFSGRSPGVNPSAFSMTRHPRTLIPGFTDHVFDRITMPRLSFGKNPVQAETPKVLPLWPIT